MTKAGPVQAQLIWAKYDPKPSPAAIEAAKNADVVVAVMGITSELEGEEMPVSEEGFKGGDRTSIDLPKPEQELLEAVAAAGKPVVLVLANGSALAVNWAQEHVNAILESWYAGEEGGAAVAETLSGKNNPAGRLPVTFYTGIDQLPPFEDYAMKGRTYRYFEGKPLYPFGYGLSYTTFSYSGLTLPKKALKAGDPLTAEVTVTNTGKREGDEVVQLYLSFPNVAGAPIARLARVQARSLEARRIAEGRLRVEGARPEHGDRSRRADHRGRDVFGVDRGRPAEHGRADSCGHISSERQQGAPGIMLAANVRSFEGLSSSEMKSARAEQVFYGTTVFFADPRA